MFAQLTTEELVNRKEKLDKQIESLRRDILIQLNNLETLCEEGVSIEEELTKRINVSNTEQT